MLTGKQLIDKMHTLDLTNEQKVLLALLRLDPNNPKIQQAIYYLLLELIDKHQEFAVFINEGFVDLQSKEVH